MMAIAYPLIVLIFIVLYLSGRFVILIQNLYMNMENFIPIIKIKSAVPSDLAYSFLDDACIVNGIDEIIARSDASLEPFLFIQVMDCTVL